MMDVIATFILLVIWLICGWVLYRGVGSTYDELVKVASNPEERARFLRESKLTKGLGISLMLFAWTAGVVVVTLLVVGGTIH